MPWEVVEERYAESLAGIGMGPALLVALLTKPSIIKKKLGSTSESSGSAHSTAPRELDAEAQVRVLKTITTPMSRLRSFGLQNRSSKEWNYHRMR